MIGPWLITSSSSLPAMLCAADESLSDDTAVALIKASLKKAKKEKISVHAITVSINDEGTHVTLCGTYGARYDK